MTKKEVDNLLKEWIDATLGGSVVKAQKPTVSQLREAVQRIDSNERFWRGVDKKYNPA